LQSVESLAERRGSVGFGLDFGFGGKQHSSQAGAAWAGGMGERIGAPVGEDAKAAPTTGRKVAEGQRHPFGDIPLSALGGAKSHRGRGVEH
jgi:hypothetical protein